jgi:hypothetical protein
MKLRRMRWAGHVAHMGAMRNAYSILVGKPEGKRGFIEARHKWEDMRLVLRELGWEGMNWVHLTQDKD